MAEFELIDLTASVPADGQEPAHEAVAGQSAGGLLGNVDTAVVASSLESLREDLAGHVKAEEGGLRLTRVTFKLSLSAEGKVALVAKGAAEASIEVVFSAPNS